MATYTNEDIIRYVEDELSPEEKQKMEEDLRADPSLAAGVELYRQLKATLLQRLPGEEGEATLRQTLGGMRSGHFGRGVRGGASGGGVDIGSPSGEGPEGHGGKVVKMKVRVDVFRKYMVGAAAAAAVLFAVVMLWPSGDYLDKYGRTQMVGTTERGEGNDSLMEQATVYFNNGQFDKALPLLDKACRADSANQAALFYRGVAYLHTGATGEARKDLEQT